MATAIGQIAPASSFRMAMVCLGLIFPLQAFLQGVNLGIPPIRNFAKKTYQAGTQNWDAAQDSRDAMYWANNDGLLRFDGTNWTCLPVANHTIVRSVAISTEDQIYVGAQSELGYFSPSHNGTLTYSSLVALLPLDQRSFEDVWDIVFWNKDVFFRTNKLVFQLTEGQLKTHRFSGPLLAMFLTPEGVVVQQEFNDLLLFRKECFEPYLNLMELKSAVTGTMHRSGDTLLFSSLKNGLFYLTNGKAGRWKTPYDLMLEEKRIYSSSTLHNGYLALGTSLDGLIVMDLQKRVFGHLNKKRGLQNNNILNTFCDRSGNVWLGLDNGIDCVVMDSPFSSIFPDSEMQGTGYAAAVFHDTLYLGVSNGAYAVPWRSYYNPENDPHFRHVRNTEGQVWSLNVIDGVLVMGHHEGAFHFQNQSASLLTSGSGAWTFVSIDEGYMLGGTYDGLALYKKDNARWIFYKKLEGLNESCRIMVKDADGAVWISHPYRGLYRITWPKGLDHPVIRFFDQAYGLPTILNNYVFPIAGKAVFATEKGVYHYNLSADRFVPDDEFNRLLGAEHRVKYLKEDKQGNVWYVTDQEVGLLLIDDFGLKKEVRKKAFPELAGKLVGGFEFIYPIDSRNVIFGTEQGFLHYNIDPAYTEYPGLQIILSQIRASGSGDSILFGGYLPQKGMMRPEQVAVLESGMNNLSFIFSATDYKNPSLIKYRVMLEGLEKEWSPWSIDTRRNYTNLGPGTYTFKVQARRKDALESDVVSYTFRIRPPWYKTNTAIVIYGIGIAGFFAGFLFRQRQKFETEKAQLTVTHQQKEAEHLREVELSKAALTEIQNEKLESEIKYKNQELALTTMHLVQKAEILLTVQEALNHIREKSSSPEVKKEIQHLLNLLNFDVNLDEDWEHFAHHFDQVHVDFLRHLREQFPQLSSNDYKLCAYLRMNLSTKEIAPLMNISVRGVEGSRYRLRRKLNLPNDANLTEFILRLPPSVQLESSTIVPSYN